ncbi:hypothetical protein [Engelhardtia mirabilis]|uniref:Uncharacterized protein n=1 Tax=Engelhardtia mirabilis TaxID=2528011 RepID=A0A518BK56_9BACT|nr:hypothetical protein Pla133_24040 [Planctomycetes bacterium Pla133]QDV01649.1 hypothetical protein Pla86_24030 [Planctomycetes bacterium Pla86]
MSYPKPDVQQWTFNVLATFRLGGRTYNPGDVLNRRHLAIGPRVIRELIDTGKIEVAS